MTILRSIGAVAAGIVLVVVLSAGTDILLCKTIFPQMNTPNVTPPLLALALSYRAIYGVASGWFTAKLAPFSPINHAIILGAIGTLAAASGVYFMWNVGNHWYPIALTVLSLPETWLGGRLATRSR